MRLDPEHDNTGTDTLFAPGRFARLFDDHIDVEHQVDILVSMNARQPTGPELAGLCGVLMERCIAMPGAYAAAVDVCGTGGDKSGTFNISTAAAFVVAGAGVPVAKHGNRSVTSRSGSVDCLEQLGVSVTMKPTEIARCIWEVGLGFLFAPYFHPAIGQVMKARKQLSCRGQKTVFNVLGPLVNPARLQRQAVGVFKESLITPVVEALQTMGSIDAMVYHGSGQDEITLTGETQIARLQNGEVTYETITPEIFGFSRCALDDLVSGGPEDSAETVHGVLRGHITGPKRNVVVLNAAAGIAVGLSKTLEDGVTLAERSIDSGEAHAKLETLVARSQTDGEDADV